MRCPHCGAANADGARFCGACGRATQATEPSRGGSNVAAGASPEFAGREIAGRYRILAKLGEGGMGAVYRGEQISLKRRCAIKLLKPELSADPGLVRRFNAEAELVARLSHPNVVNIYDFGQDADGTLFIAMEYLEGRTLRAAMNAEGPLGARRAVAIAAQVASSLTDAHAHGIVHRDLKPDNVMLTERGRDKDIVRVLDFGIAKLRDEGKNTMQAMTQAGDLVGTPQYMAPEQIRGDKVDGRTDVYALGAMIYEMVTGRLPFEGPTVMAILSKHLTETAPAPSVRRPDLGIPPALDALVMACMVKDPAQRVASMEQVGEQLGAIGVSLGGSPSQPFVIPGAPSGAHAWQPGMATQANAAAAPMAAPMTPAPAPHHPPHPPTPAAMPVLPPVGTPPPAPHAAAPAKKRKAALWIVLGVVAIGGIAAAAIVATSSKGGGSGSGSASASSGGASASDDPWAHGSGGTTSSGGASDTPPPPSPPPSLDGTIYRDPDGWSILVPSWIKRGPTKTQLNGATVLGWDGTYDGAEGGIGVVALRNVDPDMSDGDAARAVQDFATSTNSSVFAFDFATIAGKRRLRAIYDFPTGARAEAVLYAARPVSIVVMMGVDKAHFDATEAARAELFDRRVNPP